MPVSTTDLQDAEDRARAKRLKVMCLVMIAVVVVLDLWTKSYMQELLGLRPDARRSDRVIEVIPGFLRWEGTWNDGVTFGMFGGSTIPILVLTILATVGLTVWFIGTRTRSRLLPIGLALVIAGAIGNLYDRITWHKVRDFIAMYVEMDGETHTWPNYNVADAGIVLGVILIVWDALFGIGAKEAKEKEAARAAKKAAKQAAAKELRARERAGEQG